MGHLTSRLTGKKYAILTDQSVAYLNGNFTSAVVISTSLSGQMSGSVDFYDDQAKP